MDILIGPISGQYIANQLAALDLLSKYNYKPNISMGASGGMVAILSFIGGNFTSIGLERVIRDISSKDFVENWVPLIPSAVIGFFQGSIFKHPNDMKYILNNISPGILMDNEIWIQTYDIENDKTNLYCSLREGESKLYVDASRYNEMGLNKPRYMSGNIELYSKAAKATAAIPAVLPPIVINGENHVDGGIAYSSPIIPLSKSIKELKGVHIIYMIGSNIYTDDDLTNKKENPSIFDVGNVVVKYLLKSHITQDRIAGYNIVSTTCDEIEESDITLDDYFKRRSEWKSSFLEIYPGETAILSLFNFDGADLVKLYKSQVPKLKFKVRYVPKNLPNKCKI